LIVGGKFNADFALGVARLVCKSVSDTGRAPSLVKDVAVMRDLASCAGYQSFLSVHERSFRVVDCISAVALGSNYELPALGFGKETIGYRNFPVRKQRA
jgi:hypothetical protein